MSRKHKVLPPIPLEAAGFIATGGFPVGSNEGLRRLRKSLTMSVHPSHSLPMGFQKSPTFCSPTLKLISNIRDPSPLLSILRVSLGWGGILLYIYEREKPSILPLINGYLLANV